MADVFCFAHFHQQVAHVFVNLANIVVLSRGANILAEDFKYYSPATGRLDRDAFLRLTKTLDVAFSKFRVYPRDFVVSSVARCPTTIDKLLLSSSVLLP